MSSLRKRKAIKLVEAIETLTSEDAEEYYANIKPAILKPQQYKRLGAIYKQLRPSTPVSDSVENTGDDTPTARDPSTSTANPRPPSVVEANPNPQEIEQSVAKKVGDAIRAYFRVFVKLDKAEPGSNPTTAAALTSTHD